MKRNNLYLYVTASLALIVPAQGRFAYGLILLLELNVLMFFGILFRSLLKTLSLSDMQAVLLPLFLITLSIICKQLVILISPLSALILSFVLYMPAVSSLLIGAMHDEEKESLKISLSKNMRTTILFSIFALLIFLFRDIFGYGTITFPSQNGLTIFTIFKSNRFALGTFWASIPGALILTALVVVSWAYAENKIKIVRSIGENDAE